MSNSIGKKKVSEVIPMLNVISFIYGLKLNRYLDFKKAVQIYKIQQN